MASESIKNYPWLKHYEANVPHDIEIPDIPLYRFLLDAAEKNPLGDAFIYFGRRVNYHHFHELVLRFAAGLQKLGVGSGDRVALVMPNMPQFLIAYWATLYLGGVVVLINPLLSERELKYQLEFCETKVAVVLDRIYPRIEKILPESHLTCVIITYIETYLPVMLNVMFQFKKRFSQTQERISKQSNVYFFRPFLQNHPLQKIDPVDPQSAAVLLYTGGVTGSPKAAVLTHRNLVANTLQGRAWLTDIRDDSEIIMAALPFIHSYGMTACHHLAIQSRSTLILEPRFEVMRVLADIRRYNVTLFPGVPTMYVAVLNEAQKHSINLHSIRACISGGAPLPLSLKKRFERATQGHMVEGYGLTEASPISHCNPIRGESREKSIGLPWPNTEARIVDLSSGKILPPNKIGELQIRGPQVMKGYLNNTEETARVISSDGWLSTGDIAQCDEDGYFYLVDRKKDIIFYGGYNIYPSQVEEVLCEHPAIAEAAVISMPDSYYGEVPKAIVVLKPHTVTTEKEVVEFCKGKLANFKIPKKVVFVDSLPKNFLGKIMRRELMNLMG